MADTRIERISILIASLAVVVTLVLVGSARAREAVVPNLFVKYTMACTFTITDDAGATVSSVAPGPYQVYITTPAEFAYVTTPCNGPIRFQLTGPGVNLHTTLQDGDDDQASLSATFQPSSTYIAQDNNQPSVTRSVITTTAAAPATAPTTSSTSSSTPTSSSKGSSQPSLVGSAAVPFRGNLAAMISAAGRLTLTSKGKPVGTLKTGLYTFTVHDNSAKSGFSIQKLKSGAIALTGISYKGTHVKTVNLKAGQWTFFSPGGPKSYFIVNS